MAAPEPSGEAPLAGRRIAILEHREQDRLGAMLEAQGALTLRCPLVAIADAPDPAPVRAWLKRFIEASPDDLVLMTGEGLRRLHGFAEREGMAPEFQGALARVRTITRGPKPARALREIGIAPGLRAEPATSAGVAAALGSEGLRGRRVALQLYPEAPATLIDFLNGAGALPDPVWPYVYLPAAGSEETLQLIAEIEAGRIDAVAFTSAAQIVQLLALARAADVEPRLRDGLGRTRIAAVGPVVSAELERLGLAVAIMPEGRFFMKPLVTAIIAALSERGDNPENTTIR
ncbi:MAG TPA: uroporphyrinogen-III synthase [Stellaceae bacterium]|nr:uroporphyrinogen-III synthase [Stellaceae bacterium]